MAKSKITKTSAAVNGGNRHPVDRLHDLREQIAALKTEADAIREAILDGSVGQVGDEFVASVAVSKQERLDVAKVKNMLSPDQLRKASKTVVIETVKLGKLVKRKPSAAASRGLFD